MFKSMLKNIFIFALLATLFGCVGGTEGEKAVSANLSSFTTKLIIELPDNSSNIGEYLLGRTHTFQLRLVNNSAGEISGIDFSMEDITVSAYMFEAHPETADEEYPGYSGTCGTTLGAGQSCLISLSFAPSGAGTYSQSYLVKYKNIVESQSVSVSVTGTAGTAAQLFFPDEVSNIDFGVTEQTVPVATEATVTVKNSGGLRARNLTLSLTQNTSDNPPVFEIVEEDCPSELFGGFSCSVTISYTPRNNLETDPETLYAAQLAFDYETDNDGTLGSTSSFYSALSTTIQAKLKTSVSGHGFSPDLTIGNEEVKKIKVTNNGFQEGILKEIIFSTEDANSFYDYGIGDATLEDSTSHPWAICVPPTVNGFLDCSNPEIGNFSSLSQFPFRVEDLSGCFDDGKLVGAKTLELPGESCEFNIYYKPSADINAFATTPSNINATNIDVKYDSRFKDVETIRVTPLDAGVGLFTLSGGMKLPGSFRYSQTIYGLQNDDPAVGGELPRSLDYYDPSTENSIYTVNFERIALINDPSYGQTVTINFQNPNQALTTVTGVEDGTGTSIGHFEDAGWPQDMNDYYRNVSHNCSILSQGASCQITFNLTPLASNSTQENLNMFDIDDVSGQYKSFKITYNGGRTTDDSGNAIADRYMEIRIEAILVRKGFLVYQARPINDGNIGNSFAGKTEYHQVLISNVGTGPISYVAAKATPPVSTPSPNDNPNLLPLMPDNNAAVYPYEIISATPDAANSKPSGRTYPGGTLDCLDDGAGNPYVDINGLTPAAASLTPLPEGTTCALTVEMKIETLEREASNYNRVYHFYRPEHTTGEEMRRYRTYLSGGDEIYFEYYDGDGTAPGADLPGYGNLYSLDDYNVQVAFYKNSNLRYYYPGPIASGIVWYPGFTIPDIIDGATTLPGHAVSEALYYEWRSSSHSYPLNRQLETINHFNANLKPALQAGIADLSDPFEGALYMGKFPVTGETFQGKFLTYQTHAGMNISASRVLRNTGTPFTYGNTLNEPSRQPMSSRWHYIYFTPTAAGTFSNYLDFTYYDYLLEADVVHRVKVIAEAIEDTDPDPIATSYPNIDISWQAWDNTNNVLLDPTSYPLNLGTADNYGDTVTYTAIKGSAVVVEKLYTVENTSNVSVDNLNMYITAATTSITPVNSGSGYFIDQNSCNGVSLAPAQTCTFRIQYQAPLNAPPTTYRNVGLTFEIDTDLFISKNFRVALVAKSPAQLSISGAPTEPSFDNIRGFTYPTSYLMQLGGFSSPTHPIFSTDPTSKVLGPYTVVNSSDIKASFLKMVTPAPATTWTDVFDDGLKKIEATRPCFYGDDEFDGAVPAYDKGFNDTTTAVCQIRFTYSETGKYLGLDINSADEMIHLEFWDAFRDTTSELHLHVKGFIEPDRSTASAGDFNNIATDSSGSLSFSWPTVTADNIGVGNITGFRVFYNTSPTDISGNIFDDVAGFVDIGDPGATDYTIYGLNPGYKYYVRLAALRVFDGDTYVSSIDNLPILDVIVPPNNVIYDHDLSILVDRGITTGIGTKSELQSLCTSKSYSIFDGGSPITFNKQLLNQNVLDFLLEDSDRSEYFIGAVTHWIADNAVDIEPIFTPYGYDETVVQQYYPTPNILYSKSCEDNTCAVLSWTYGGDGEDLPPSSYLYIDSEAISASARCWADVSN